MRIHMYYTILDALPSNKEYTGQKKAILCNIAFLVHN